ncbi:MAG: protein kinase [Anaerolineales bacterium]|nr:protein kinase [Anaerolineales bacterium]MBX3037662.1 protein kinase [Anaerolineales bacterium]
MTQKIAKNQIFGSWKLKKFLGGGGNGDVWLAVNSNNEEGAIKLLRKIDKKTYTRFINEINVIKENKDISGILQILDSYLPDNLSDEIPWYVMPVAQPLEKYLEEKHFEDTVLAIIQVAKTLFELHKRNISHRDIKPENLLFKDGEIYIGDFGLVDYPDKIELTSSGDAIGAKWTIAPEMRREGYKSDGKPADTYSLAKTLWILITKQKKGFDGQYNPNGINGLSKLNLTMKEDISYTEERYKRPAFIKPLDDLLIQSTDDSPQQRPSIEYFLKTLTWWIDTQKDLQTRNPIEWKDLQQQLFPITLPQRAVWENLNDIAYVLNLIGSVRALNHMFYPTGGGMDLQGARQGFEVNTIELDIDIDYIILIKPKRLIFENFNADPKWNYFRIETDGLKPSGIGHVNRNREELVEVEPLEYVSRSSWNENLYEGKNNRLVIRFLKGDFVIFSKISFYNHASSTYDGRHNQMSTDEFRDYIANKVQIAQELLVNEEILKIAKEKEININDVLSIYFKNDFHSDYMKRFRDKSLNE